MFKVLSVPASSATCEQVFSSAGQVCSKRRGRLSPERIEQLTLLKINLKKIEDFKKTHDINKIDTADPFSCGWYQSTSHNVWSDDLEESDLGCLYENLSDDEEEGYEDEDEDEDYCEIND